MDDLVFPDCLPIAMELLVHLWIFYFVLSSFDKMNHVHEKHYEPRIQNQRYIKWEDFLTGTSLAHYNFYRATNAYIETKLQEQSNKLTSHII